MGKTLEKCSITIMKSLIKIINVSNVIQCKYDKSKTLTGIMEYFLKIETNISFMIMFDNIE